VINDSAAAALPGERVNIGADDLPCMATATHRYYCRDGDLFRNFAWSDFEICNAPAFSPKGEWMWVRGHWKQFKRNGHRCNGGQP